jgi:pyruvate/2-oxoglutarate/acetoin dehydrogenase E1 component
MPDTPIPYSEPLERELVVSAERIAAATRGLLEHSR